MPISHVQSVGFIVSPSKPRTFSRGTSSDSSSGSISVSGSLGASSSSAKSRPSSISGSLGSSSRGSKSRPRSILAGRDVISKCQKFDISPRRRIEFESATVKLVRKMGKM